ncbi:vitamin K-dependent protein C isoform 2-T2 [Vipera latastei]
MQETSEALPKESNISLCFLKYIILKIYKNMYFSKTNHHFFYGCSHSCGIGCAMGRIISLLAFSAAFILLNGYGASVFYSSQEANRVLKIQKRANSFLEELKAGSLERECLEEQCDFEEASEIFETMEKTIAFWAKYIDGDMCVSSPCLNGFCQDGIGRFDCICNKGWEGRFCQNVEYSCGRIVESKLKVAKIIGGNPGKRGDSPWQVMLGNSAGEFKCGGVLIHPAWVLTAAHCVFRESRIKLILGKYHRRRIDESEITIIADKIFIHENYSSDTYDNDIAILHLSHPVVVNKYIIPICLPTQNLANQQLMTEGIQTIVTGWGSQSANSKKNFSSVLNFIEIPVASRNDCIHSMWNSLTDNMFCAGIPGDIRDSCHGDSGGPMVVKFKNTWFLLGLVSWGEGCGDPNNFGIYTKISSYLDWIRQKMKS